MTKLALFGGEPSVRGPLAKYNSITAREQTAALVASHDTLSGFLGGEPEGGVRVRALEAAWNKSLRVPHSVSVNSATSGLLAAAHAIGLGPGDEFIVSPYTMSATVAAPAFFGATPVFVDIEPNWYCLDLDKTIEAITRKTKAIVVTNLFGHPAQLRELRNYCDDLGIFLIEDNAQSPFSTEDHRFAGTVGHIGVFSLNVHKHLQAGEGGICVTRDDDLARKLQEFRNHGEMAGSGLGLNLRMTEMTAAMALTQLERADTIISGRVRQAEGLTGIVRKIDWVRPMIPRLGCKHVYYHWVFEINLAGTNRETVAEALRAEGLPVNCGYVDPLYTLPAFEKYAAACEVTEEKQSKSLLYFENCGYTLSNEQTEQIGDAFRKIERNIKDLRP